MSTSEQLIERRKQYVSCLNYAAVTADKLSNAIKTLNGIIDTQKQCYTIDGENNGGSFLNNLLEKETNIYDYIVNDVIPGTKAIIAEYNNLIQEAIIRETAISAE